MTNPTSNFGWQMPTASDLVTDLPADFETFGQAVDTSLADLKGGTTGQVLSKASNTDMDFTWVAQDDSNAIQNAIVDAKGDLIAASAADTPARLAVGNNGETLVADGSTATGLRYQGNFATGKNKIINGDFRINQRSFTSTTADSTYTFDRWITERGVGGGGTVTYSAQTFTPGTAPVAGYEAQNFLQIVTAGQSAVNDYALIDQRIEDVRTFANQTITVSFWAKATSGTPKIGVAYLQNFGSGGSSSVIGNIGDVTITTAWARYSVTITIPSISGKTVGSSSFLRILSFTSAGSTYTNFTSIGLQNNTIGLWGFQAENGNVATAFQTATGTIQGELAACMRYFQRITNGAESSVENTSNGFCRSTTTAICILRFVTVMRTAPSLFVSNVSHFALKNSTDGNLTPTAIAIYDTTARTANLQVDVSSGVVAGNATRFGANSASATLDLSAEL